MRTQETAKMGCKRLLFPAVFPYQVSKLTHSVMLSDGAVSYALPCERYSVLSTLAEFWINAAVLTGAEFQSTGRTRSCASALPSRQNEHEVDLESRQTERDEAGVPQ